MDRSLEWSHEESHEMMLHSSICASDPSQFTYSSHTGPDPWPNKAPPKDLALFLNVQNMGNQILQSSPTLCITFIKPVLSNYIKT